MASAIRSTTNGATPSEGSSSITSRGLPISVRATVSICCSPPLMLAPARPSMPRRFGKRSSRRADVHVGASGRGACRPTSRFSRTVRSVKMRRSSGTHPSPILPMRCAGCAEMSRPPNRIVPSRRSTSPITAFIVVDLPAPLRPISATTSPRPTSSDRSKRMRARPYQADSPSTCNSGAPRGRGASAPGTPLMAAPRPRRRGRPRAPPGRRGSRRAHPRRSAGPARAPRCDRHTRRRHPCCAR